MCISFPTEKEQYSSDIHLKPRLTVGILGLKHKSSLSIDLKYFNLQRKRCTDICYLSPTKSQRISRKVIRKVLLKYFNIFHKAVNSCLDTSGFASFLKQHAFIPPIESVSSLTPNFIFNFYRLLILYAERGKILSTLSR